MEAKISIETLSPKFEQRETALKKQTSKQFNANTCREEEEEDHDDDDDEQTWTLKFGH